MERPILASSFWPPVVPSTAQLGWKTLAIHQTEFGLWLKYILGLRVESSECTQCLR